MLIIQLGPISTGDWEGRGILIGQSWLHTALPGYVCKSRLDLWDDAGAVNALQRAEQQNGNFGGGHSFRLGCVGFLIRESDPL